MLPSSCWSWRLTSWIKGVDVDAQVHGLLRTNPVPDLLDDTISTDLVNLSSLHDLEAAVAIILIVGGSRQCRANTGVDVGVIGKEALLRSMEEVRAVVDASLLARRATEDLRLPGVAKRNVSFVRLCPEQKSLQMTVEVNDTDRAILAVD